MRPPHLSPRSEKKFIRYIKDTRSNAPNLIAGEIYLVESNKYVTQSICHACKGKSIIYHEDIGYYYEVGLDIKDMRRIFKFCPQCHYKHIRYKRLRGISASLSMIKIRNSK